MKKNYYWPIELRSKIKNFQLLGMDGSATRGWRFFVLHCLKHTPADTFVYILHNIVTNFAYFDHFKKNK
nr:MAG TPA: hypothetical protein [Caudoviricetes sp.]